METLAKNDKNGKTWVSGILAIIFVAAASGGDTGSNGIGVDSARAYVANMGSNNVSVINTATNALVATVTVGDQPSDLALTPDGSRAYVTNNNSGTVSVIATATNTVVATVPVCCVPFAIAIH
jgi:YVTN family beta-propeller protein